jgi:cytochrome c-type biogenesis protein CcmH
MKLPRTAARSIAALLLAWTAAALLAPAFAVDSTPPIADPVLQQRYLALTHELRCMQCQGEALADSSVPLAAEVRREVHDLVLQGLTERQVRDHMVARYGEFILYRPPVSWRNAWLWGTSPALMIIGALIAWRVLRSRRPLIDQDPAVFDEDSDEELHEDSHEQSGKESLPT